MDVEQQLGHAAHGQQRHLPLAMVNDGHLEPGAGEDVPRVFDDAVVGSDAARRIGRVKRHETREVLEGQLLEGALSRGSDRARDLPRDRPARRG